MTIVDKYSIRVPLIVGILLVLFINLIYFIVLYYIENEYFTDLQRKVNMRQELFFEVLNQDKNLLAKMDKQSTLQYNNESYSIADIKGKIIYSLEPNKNSLDTTILQKLKSEKVVKTISNGLYRLSYIHKDNDADRTVILDISGYNNDGKNEQDLLCNLLIISTIGIIIVIAITTRILY
jgi:hypothetical protein